MASSLFLSEISNTWQSCCNEEKNEPVCFSGRSEAANLQHSLVENTGFAIRPKFTSLQRHVSLQFQSCVKTIPWHYVPFHEKGGQGKLFCECWMSYLLLPWLGETVLSDNFPAISFKQAVSFRKHKYMTKIVAMKRKINQDILGAGMRLQLTSFHRRKICLLTSCPFIQVHKNTFFFPAVSELCNDTPRAHRTIPWE